MLIKLAKGVKDGALGLALKSFINDKLSRFGQITECQIDTSTGRVQLTALLKGEKESVTAAIERYEIERDGDDRYIRLRSFSSSREWLTVLLNERLTDRQFKLPSAISSLL
jgi:hypothetical protein